MEFGLPCCEHPPEIGAAEAALIAAAGFAHDGIEIPFVRAREREQLGEGALAADAPGNQKLRHIENDKVRKGKRTQDSEGWKAKREKCTCVLALRLTLPGDGRAESRDNPCDLHSEAMKAGEILPAQGSRIQANIEKATNLGA